MARKTSTRKSEPLHPVVQAALTLAESKGWRGLSLAEIAAEAKTSLADLYALYPSKMAILDGFSRHIDRRVLAGAERPEPEEGARDRLFDLLMHRFDALDSHKAGVSAILRDISTDPAAAVCAAVSLRRSMSLTLEAAGISASGLAGMLKVKGLMAVYLSSLRAWLGDDSPDKARTMAAVDAGLRCAERFAAMLKSGSFRRKSAGA